MESLCATVLVVDDEPLNLEILVENLEEEGYRVVPAADGERAWTLLQAEPERFDAVLLDRMMPRMDGMAVLARIKEHERLRPLPVIMQTARAARQDVLEGLHAGAHYYLTKPFEREAMLAVLRTAVGDYRRYRELREQLARGNRTLRLLQSGRFAFRSLDEARDLAALLAGASGAGNRVVTGLSELFINAVEHGNLGIGYAEKSQLNDRGQWQDEVERRLALPENLHKQVIVDLQNRDDEQIYRIRDQGRGFDWRGYLQVQPERAFDNHGRGIAMANLLSFDRLEYRGCGNEVEAAVKV